MEKLHLIFVPSPGVGHLFSAIELAKQLVGGGHGHQCRATILIMQSYRILPWVEETESCIDAVASSGLDVDFEELPHVDPPQRENMKGETFMCLFVEAHKAHVRDSVSRCIAGGDAAAAAALVLDLLCASMLDVAHEVGVPGYIYVPSNAAFLGLMLYLPTLHAKVTCEWEDVREDMEIPGLTRIPSSSLPTFMMDKKNEAYTILLNYGYRFREASGFLINTFEELEAKPLKALEAGHCLPDHPMPPVFSVGPLLAVGRKAAGKDKHECIKWLDGQPESSVVFLCFGSIGCFPPDVVREMALGLEKSGCRFLWSLRTPSRENAHLPGDADVDEVLPEGFTERTRERGFVWPSWIPQLSVLQHPAIGGFVTHCGWNSILESLWNGVPMIAWPLYAEQHMNAVKMAMEMGVALEIKVDRSNRGFAGAEEVESAVIRLIQGEEGRRARQTAKEMMMAGRKAMDVGGSSFTALELFIQEIKKGASAK